jgi:hypothetical protein
LIDGPAQRSTSLLHDRFKFITRVEIESQQQSHSVSERLKQAMFIRGRQQQTEIRNLHAQRLFPAIHDDPPLVESEVKGRLIFRFHFVALIDEYD